MKKTTKKKTKKKSLFTTTVLRKPKKKATPKNTPTATGKINRCEPTSLPCLVLPVTCNEAEGLTTQSLWLQISVRPDIPCPILPCRQDALSSVHMPDRHQRRIPCVYPATAMPCDHSPALGHQ